MIRFFALFVCAAIAAPAWGQQSMPRAQVAPQLAPRPSAGTQIPPAASPETARGGGATRLTLVAGTGRLLPLPGPALTVLAADPRIARVQPASPTSLFVMGVGAGRTTIVATAEDGSPVAEYDVTVLASAPAAPASGAPAAEGAAAAPGSSPAAIESMIHRLVPGAAEARVAAAGPRLIVLSGQVASAADAQRAEAMARAMAGTDREISNRLVLLGSIQVNVRVRVAEISRQVSRELGFNWQALANTGGNFLIGLRSGAVGAVAGALTGAAAAVSGVPQRYGVAYNSSRFDINAVIDALAEDQLITILAEPNLTAQSGEVASFLAGGEFPVPVAASSTSNAITIEFKPFGISLAFVPTVLAPDRLNLRIRPEVSELTENGSISLPLSTGVVRIPALNVRRAETTVELGSGQSFAIAGLLSSGSTTANSGLAGLTDIPVLGALFRSDRFRRNETELVIIVTPYLVRPVSDPGSLVLPTDGIRPATDLDRILYRRQIARGLPTPPGRSALDAGFILE
ncbi:type II and III secretion system protein family protein [Muricoccus aerilatus]|uniref:type II and III secretion system protein family protein n=1 Tax=Muricoccus aerilatus TaxID=452982 RepID=UPI000694FFAC|nr:type II and III secretion system protein family protein [Roseomonas aerilata]